MIYGLYQSAAAMMTHEYRQGVIANNLANAETVGFKRDIASISERTRAKSVGASRAQNETQLAAMSGGVWLGETETDYSPGAMQRTDSPTDVAISGAGFFRVQVGTQELLTRDGRFVVDGDGLLVAATDGAPVLSDAGQPIRVNPRSGPIAIDETGVVQQNGFQLGRLSVVDVADRSALRKAGVGRYIPGTQKLTDAPTPLRSGHVEQSGVQPVHELTGMLEASRAYQMNAQMLTLQDQSAGRLIQAVSS